jgi:hypothetical protein
VAVKVVLSGQAEFEREINLIKYVELRLHGIEE